MGVSLEKFYGAVTKRGSVGSTLLETAEYAGASMGLGYLYGRYREKASLFGVPADLAVGLLGKTVGLGLDLFSRGSGGAGRQFLHAVGNAGLGAVAHKLGTGLGLRASGRKVVSLPAGAMLPAGATLLGGDLPSAPPGDALGDADLEALSRVGRRR